MVTRAVAVLLAAVVGLAGCAGSAGTSTTVTSSQSPGVATSSGLAPTSTPASAPPAAAATPRRGIPVNTPWATLYGTASRATLERMAQSFRLIVVDAGREGGITATDVALLRSGGATVISYLNVGACERFRTYWSTAPAGFVPCGGDRAAQLGPYAGYPDETWMNPSEAAYGHLIVDFVAPRLAQTGVDGFFLDNLEIIEHAAGDTNGPCDFTCSQGGLDLVFAVRQRFPSLVMVMQNATGERSRTGTTHGMAFPLLLDGVSHEQVFGPNADSTAEGELIAWSDLSLSVAGRRFSITTEDYVGSCDNREAAQRIYSRSRGDGFSPYATDASAGQQQVCFWGL